MRNVFFLGKMRLIPTAFSVVIFTALIVVGFVDSKTFVDMLWGVFKWLMVNLGWLVDLGCMGFVLALIGIFIHPLGRVKFGGPEAKPQFSTWNWWAISLCAGIGTGIVFWGAVEPLKHTFAPAGGMGLEPGSKAAMIWAMRTSFLHWTLTPYAIYVIAAIAIGLAYYNLGKQYTVSAGLSLLYGKKEIGKNTVNIVDGLTLFAITGGVAGSLGYGLLQVGSGLDFTFGIQPGPLVWTLVAAAIIASYLISSFTGLNNGIRWLSDKKRHHFHPLSGAGHFLGAHSVHFQPDHAIHRCLFKRFSACDDLYRSFAGRRLMAAVVGYVLVCGLAVVRPHRRTVPGQARIRPYAS